MPFLLEWSSGALNKSVMLELGWILLADTQTIEDLIWQKWSKLIVTTPSFYNYVCPNRLAESTLGMSCGGGRPMSHFLFSFPRAGAAPGQVPECITVMVTMALWKASCPDSWACAPHQPFHLLLPNDSTFWLSPYPVPANQRWQGMLGPRQNAAHSLVLFGHSESQRWPCVKDGICLGGAVVFWFAFDGCF